MNVLILLSAGTHKNIMHPADVVFIIKYLKAKNEKNYFPFNSTPDFRLSNDLLFPGL